jgi:hypothetical protein
VIERRAVIELVYRDASGSNGAVTIHVPPDTTYADADVGAMALASVLASLTGGTLVKQRIKYLIVRDPTTVPLDGSDVVHRGAFVFADAADNAIGLCEVPGILDRTLLTSGPCADVCIDLSNSDIADFIDAIITNGATDPFATPFDHIFSAYVQSRV